MTKLQVEAMAELTRKPRRLRLDPRLRPEYDITVWLAPAAAISAAIITVILAR